MTENRFSFGSNAYTRFSLVESIRQIASYGYSAVEILADRPHAFVPEMTDGSREDLIVVLDETKIKVGHINVNTAQGFWWPEPPGSQVPIPSLQKQ